jgi:CO/xanthine dehydrogenase Mo-binding subunit
VATIDRAMGGHPPIVPVPPALGCAVVWALGRLRGDVLLTREELRG